MKEEFTLGDSLSGSVKLTKNADLDKYKYTGYDIGFDSRSEFLFTDGSFGKNVMIFATDMSPSMHSNNKGKDIIVLGEGPTQRLDDTTLAAEAIYPINFTPSNKWFVLSLHYNWTGSNLLMLQMDIYIYIYINLKQKKYKTRICTVFR